MRRLVNYTLTLKDYKESFDRVIEIMGREIGNREELHADLKRKFKFSSYYGENLDALYDLLSEISENTLIIIWDKEVIRRNLGEYWEGFIEVLRAVEQENMNIRLLLRK